jgi:uncharacterized membrane protein
MIVDKKRHILKSISYRLLSTATGFIIVYFSTGSLKIGATFSFIEIIYKPIQYYIHERVWYKFIKFGLKKQDK